jgi:AcrR family transcriptional regulator
MESKGLQAFELEDESKLSRRERDERQRIHNILSVALRLVGDRGFSEFSMQQLAEATDYSRAALYKYFPRKEEIVIALAIESLKRRVHLYRVIPGFDGRPRERMVAMGEVSAILYPELFNVELLAFTNTFRDRTTRERRRQVHDLENVGYRLGAQIVSQAVACGDLEMPAGMTPEQLFFGQSMQLIGIFGEIFASGPELAETLGIGEPARSARHFGSALLDGFNWRPLSTEWDYRTTMRRIYEELFPPVVIDRIKRF